jgi:hypothetical protein
MDVYSSDGEKIGTVADTPSSNVGETRTTGMPAGHSGGGEGALGDEDRVPTDTGVDGGPGTLGDEARVYGGTGTGGGRETLGDETAVNRDYGAAGGPATPGGETPIVDYEEVDTVIEEVPRTSANTEAPGGMPSPRATTGGTGTTQAASTVGYETAGTATGVATGYFEVDHGGFLGIGAKALYVPYSAVQQVIPGDRVVLNCTKDECIGNFGE